MNQGNSGFQPYISARKQFFFVTKPRLSIQQLDIKFNKQERKQVLHRRKSEIDFRRLRKKNQNQNNNQQQHSQECRIKLPVISKKNFQLEIQQAQNIETNFVKFAHKKDKNLLHAKSVNLLKRSKSNFENYEEVQHNNKEDKEDDQNNKQGELNSGPTVELLQGQACKNQAKLFYISELSLSSIQNKEQLTRRSLIEKLILKKQEQQKLCGIVNKKIKAKVLKNYNMSFKLLSKQIQRRDEFLSKKLQIVKKQKQVKIRVPKQNKPAFFNNKQNCYALQGWEIRQEEDIFLVQQS